MANVNIIILSLVFSLVTSSRVEFGSRVKCFYNVSRNLDTTNS